MIYSGIINKKAPKHILELFSIISQKLEQKGHFLRTGGSYGLNPFDSKISTSNRQLFFMEETTDEAIDMASKHLPIGYKCDSHNLKLRGRNCMLLFGNKLDIPSRFIICWFDDQNEEKSHTGFILRMCERYNIKIFNLFYEATVNNLKERLEIS